ncbi:peptidoglycan DD-metalloendopeptidase family protein [Rubrobacter tropicus]|uniref:Peptidoglycan DD-metalloendopeptidase family protein n=1 Tax=Rubrobacter tropicus TaxID=2653851 RepID=A0A6G8Q5J7_9ACTN|nr:M23 family metallopeptidase [Rubrobacter tropicus]QIN81730.1 peptidoglycan DD-metalloendopeptidase family protein [Rubrobacter tropicus]
MRNHHNILGFVLLTLAAVMGVVGPGSGAEARQADGAPPTEKTGGEAVGASVVHPEEWTVEREPYTFDRTYGYTLWYPDTDEAHDHGGTPALRVALAYDLEPGDIEGEVRETISAYPDLPMKRETVGVAERGYGGVAVGPIPGSTPFTEVYVPVNGRVYKINAYLKPGQEGLSAQDRDLLSGVKFEPPSRSVASLDVPAANAPETLYDAGNQRLLSREQETRAEALSFEPEQSRASTDPKAAGTGEAQISEGCWRANSDFFVQTQHGLYANSRSDDGIPTGRTVIGKPNYWGQYTHGNLGYGRCASDYYTNDKFAVDYPMNRGDALWSPFKCGRVTFAGRNESHKNYGIFVVIKSCHNKYVSMSAHLNALKRGISRGDNVSNSTVIGFAGDTGDPSIPVGRVHLHQAFYRYPKYLQDGSPYGGRGLQVVRHRFVGTSVNAKSPGIYSFGWKHDDGATCRRGIICGKGYKISN